MGVRAVDHAERAHPGMNSRADKENPFKRVKISIRVHFNALYISDCDFNRRRRLDAYGVQCPFILCKNVMNTPPTLC